jgi:concanavalin A-like lectin/glucanase superfamily protein
VLKLILDHDFDKPVPAVDRSPFANHGQIFNASFNADGREAGSGALRFQQPDSAVRIAWRPVWQKLTAIALEAWVRVSANGQRRNIIEGDGSFAFYVNPDDTLVGSVFSLVDGMSGPAWHVVSSATHSPDGVVHRVPLNQWCKVVFHHDGITRARLFLNDSIIAVRGDYRSGVGAVAGAGIVVGNWTLSNQFAFSGLIDRVRVWKHDEAEMTRQFSARHFSPQTRDQWDEIWACLAAHLNPDMAVRLRSLGKDWEQLLRELFRAVHAASQEDRDEFRRIIEAYRKHWRANSIDTGAAADVIVALQKWITKALGPAWTQRTEQVVQLFISLLGEGAKCFDPKRLAALDPEFYRFMGNVVTQFS